VDLEGSEADPSVMTRRVHFESFVPPEIRAMDLQYEAR
jgi:hypothetical protein